ncbi:MAG: AarF/ABC1/UbiB kinase family protein [Actinomycetota bacterium]|nr:AarF/ABC1/UbiB kinase family protein [Actinomycetota bacterium]
MSVSLRPQHAGRYRDIARLLVKYGRSDLVKEAGLDDLADYSEEGDVPPKAEELTNDLERMGPTYIKLAQLMSTRADLIPPPYAKALSRLQDSVEPFPFEEVERIVTEELGVRLSRAFSSFDATPLASASLGQVHKAVLRDGRPVAVKIQRPNIKERIAEDMEALAELAEFADKHSEVGRKYGFGELLEQFRRSLNGELDYRREAANLSHLARIVSKYDRIVIPEPIEDYTTSIVLTMDYIPGRKITSLGPLAKMELDGCALAEQLFEAYLDQILVEGFFHADPHPGNVLLTDDNRIALIDLGMVARIPGTMRKQLIKLLLALSDGNGKGAADAAITLGRPLEDFDEASFSVRAADMVERSQGATVDEIDAGSMVMELMRISGDFGLRLPAELSMLGKALLNLDQVARELDPDFDPASAIRRHTDDILETQMRPSSGSTFSALLEARDFVEQLPGRVNKVMDAMAEGTFHLDVHAFDEAELMRGFQKLANRLTMGLVVAALIIGAAMLVQVETSSKLFGYPTLAILCFLGAAAFGFALLFSILRADRKVNDQTRNKRL